jgi:hypothetical protein
VNPVDVVVTVGPRNCANVLRSTRYRTGGVSDRGSKRCRVANHISSRLRYGRIVCESGSRPVASDTTTATMSA